MRVDEGHEVIHVLPGAPFGGLQVIILELARAQIRRGRRVTLALTDGSDRLAARAEASGIPIRMFKGGKPGRALALGAWLARRRRATIHSHCEPIWATIVLAMLRPPRWVAHLHTYARPGDSRKERAIHFLHRHGVARFIAITRSVADSFLQRGLAREERLDVVHNGLDHADPGERPMAGDRANFSICFAGRIVAEKGIFDFVALADRLRGEAGIRFVVAGIGPELDAAREQAARLGIEDRIEFLGFVEDMASLWSSADLFVMLSEKEPFGLVILEAIANGVSVLGYDTPSGGQEIMAMIPGCRTVTGGSIDALAAAVLDLKSHPVTLAEEIALGQRIVRERFSIDRMEAEISEVYSRRLRPRHPRSA